MTDLPKTFEPRAIEDRWYAHWESGGLFRPQRGDRVKIVHWDTSGLVLVWKQLEGGALRWPPITGGSVRLSAVQFAALSAGLDFSRVENARRIPTPTAAA